MARSHLKLAAPTEILRTVAPGRRPNAELRTREHLTPGAVGMVSARFSPFPFPDPQLVPEMQSLRSGAELDRKLSLPSIHWQVLEQPARPRRWNS
jgi:hypothetical protein